MCDNSMFTTNHDTTWFFLESVHNRKQALCMTMSAIANFQWHQRTNSYSTVKCSLSTNFHSLYCKFFLLAIFLLHCFSANNTFFVSDDISTHILLVVVVVHGIVGLCRHIVCIALSHFVLFIIPVIIATSQIHHNSVGYLNLSWCQPCNPLPDLVFQSSQTCVMVRWQKISWNRFTSSWMSGTL